MRTVSLPLALKSCVSGHKYIMLHIPIMCLLIDDYLKYLNKVSGR